MDDVKFRQPRPGRLVGCFSPLGIAWAPEPRLNGFFLSLRPDEFIDLVVLPRQSARRDSSERHFRKHIVDGIPLGNPILYLDWHADASEWSVHLHDGRHRVLACQAEFGNDVLMPVYANVRLPTRMNRIAPGTIAAPIVNQQRTRRFSWT